jgi:hypothetical protein
MAYFEVVSQEQYLSQEMWSPGKLWNTNQKKCNTCCHSSGKQSHNCVHRYISFASLMSW